MSSIIGDDPDFEAEILLAWRDQKVKDEFGDLDRYRHYRWAMRCGLVKHPGPFKFRSLEDAARALAGVYADTPAGDLLRDALQAQGQSDKARQRNKPAQVLAYQLAHRLWWDEDRERPEPRSTEGSQYIAELIQSEGLGRFTADAVKGWLTDAQLIPDYARKGGRPRK